MSTAIAEAIMGENEKSRETSRALVQEAKDDQGSNAVLGRTRGVFAEAVNRIESGAMIAHGDHGGALSGGFHGSHADPLYCGQSGAGIPGVVFLHQYVYRDHEAVFPGRPDL